MKILLVMVIALPSLFFLQTTVTAQTFSQGNRIVNAQCSIEVEREGRFKFPCHAEFDQDGSVQFNDLQMLIRCKGGKQSCAGFEEEVVREGHFGSIEVYGESVRLCWNRGFLRSAQGCIEGLKKVGNCAQRVVEPCFSQNTRDCAQSVYACVVPVPVSSLSLQDTFKREESARQVASESLAEINERWRKSIKTYRCSRDQSKSAIDFYKRFGTHPDDPGYIHFYKAEFMSRSSNNRFPRSKGAEFTEPVESKSPTIDGWDAWRRVQRKGETLYWVWRTVEFVGGSEQSPMEFNLREKRLFFREDWNQNLTGRPKILALQCQEVPTR